MKNYKYLAGIIDGEGCIGVYKAKDKGKYLKYFVCVVVKNTSEELIFWLKENFGGHIKFQKTKNKKWKDCWGWHVNSKKAVTLLKKVLPYLIVKKEQAELSIKFQKKVKRYGVMGVPKDVLEERESFYIKSRKLNQRGITGSPAGGQTK